MRVGVVGGGVSGMAAAHELARACGGTASVTVYEAEESLGGHARTAEVDGVHLDLGFMVFNRVLSLLSRLGTAEAAHTVVLSTCTNRSPLLSRLGTAVLSMRTNRSPLLSRLGTAEAARTVLLSTHTNRSPLLSRLGNAVLSTRTNRSPLLSRLGTAEAACTVVLSTRTNRSPLLSRLGTAEAARTIVLSTRFRDAWLATPSASTTSSSPSPHAARSPRSSPGRRAPTS
ncbi:hypothetical protein D1007_55311 [Hordeum vulgare]|nr:hypothetical protein D1007_55311 [Hordeum vulgare]